MYQIALLDKFGNERNINVKVLKKFIIIETQVNHDLDLDTLVILLVILTALRPLSLSLTDSDIQTFLEREENQTTERKTESYVFSGFGNGILTAENENENWKICHRPILTVYLKDFFCW